MTPTLPTGIGSRWSRTFRSRAPVLRSQNTRHSFVYRDGTGAAGCLGVGDVKGILQITGRVLLFVVSDAKKKTGAMVLRHRRT